MKRFTNLMFYDFMFLKRFTNLKGYFDEGMTVFCVLSFKAERIISKEKKCYGDLRSISLNSVLLCNCCEISCTVPWQQILKRKSFKGTFSLHHLDTELCKSRNSSWLTSCRCSIMSLNCPNNNGKLKGSNKNLRGKKIV